MLRECHNEQARVELCFEGTDSLLKVDIRHETMKRLLQRREGRTLGASHRKGNPGGGNGASVLNIYFFPKSTEIYIFFSESQGSHSSLTS